jgi:hypothetical protein
MYMKNKLLQDDTADASWSFPQHVRVLHSFISARRPLLPLT